MMKTATLFALVLLVVLSLAACGQEAKDTADGTNAGLSTSYDNALPAVMQLVVGTLRLENTDMAVSAAQATDLLPLWKGYRSLSGSDAASSAELEALDGQILAAMTSEQIQAVAAMQLTREDLDAAMDELGIVSPRGGASSDLSDEEREALRAERQAQGGFPVEGGVPGAPPESMAPGGGQAPGASGGTRPVANTVLFDVLIETLSGKTL